jgi:hypothetical protein
MVSRRSKGRREILGRKASPGKQARQERKEKRGRRETLGLPAPRLEGGTLTIIDRLVRDRRDYD